MTLFWIATVLAVVLAALYVRAIAIEFQFLRSEGAAPPDESEVGTVESFALKAVVGVMLSIACLLLISYTAWGWYLLPVLGMGTAVAVIIAFAIDRRARTKGHHPHRNG